MNERPYKLINPAEVFSATVEVTMKKVTALKMRREYTCNIEVKPTGCEFLDVFARLVAAHGKKREPFYATRMGVEGNSLHATIIALSGVRVNDWSDVFASTMVEALLSKTNWPISRIAETAHFSGPIVFNQWFRRKYKCKPHEWRQRK